MYVDYTMTFASLIARCAKDIDYLIESLPSEDSSTELQVCNYSLSFVFSLSISNGAAEIYISMINSIYSTACQP